MECVPLLLSLLLPTFSEWAQPARNLVPEGLMIIAQRFIAGNAKFDNDLSPVGTDEFLLDGSIVPPGLCSYSTALSQR